MTQIDLSLQTGDTRPKKTLITAEEFPLDETSQGEFPDLHGAPAQPIGCYLNPLRET